MNKDGQQEARGFDIIIDGESRLFAELEVSAIMAAGFHKENYPEHTVQIRARSANKLRHVLGYARLE
jgi:hypothetical protein